MLPKGALHTPTARLMCEARFILVPPPYGYKPDRIGMRRQNPLAFPSG